MYRSSYLFLLLGDSGVSLHVYVSLSIPQSLSQLAILPPNVIIPEPLVCFLITIWNRRLGVFFPLR